MVAQEMLVKMFDYDAWANQRILESARRLTGEQYLAPTSMSHGSLQALLAHMLRTIWIWRMLSQQASLSGQPPYQPHIFPNVDSLLAPWQQEQLQLTGYLAGLDEADLAATVQVRGRQGNVTPMIRWQMLMHLALHNMQHRTEAAAILTSFGHSPGDLDFIFFI